MNIRLYIMHHYIPQMSDYNFSITASSAIQYIADARKTVITFISVGITVFDPLQLYHLLIE